MLQLLTGGFVSCGGDHVGLWSEAFVEAANALHHRLAALRLSSNNMNWNQARLVMAVPTIVGLCMPEAILLVTNTSDLLEVMCL